jgi:serine/threonine protein kinase/formylglycine-generating enzyme required for sulfatase activity
MRANLSFPQGPKDRTRVKGPSPMRKRGHPYDPTMSSLVTENQPTTRPTHRTKSIRDGNGQNHIDSRRHHHHHQHPLHPYRLASHHNSRTITPAMPTPPPGPTTNDRQPEPPTQSIDPILIEGLRTYTEQGLEAWHRYLAAHPDHAPKLRTLLTRLESVGINPQQLPQAPPTHVGHFEIVDRLGDGGMGIVWRCRRDSDRKLFAVKVVRPELLLAPGARDRFVREMRTVSSLKHPGIVAIEAVDDAGSSPWYAMELVPGAPLDQILRMVQQSGAANAPAKALAAIGVDTPKGANSAMAWVRGIVQIITQVAEALAFAHSRGVVHRDVKPSNLLVTPEGRAVLIDFGLARPNDATTITTAGMELGSLPYMAPELLHGLSEPDSRGDVYSLGVALYQSLTLESPFHTATAEGTRRAVLRAMPRPVRTLNPSVDADLAAVCRVAMDPDPRRRYATADALAVDLRRWLARQRPLARPPGPWLRLRRWTQHHPARAFGSLAAVLLLVVLPSTIAWQQSRALAANLRLSDLHLVQDLVERERSLWPARPERLGGAEGMDSWLAQAADVISRRAQHLADRDALRQGATRLSEAEAVQRSDAARRIQKEIALLQNNLDTARHGQMAGWEDWVTQLERAQAPLRRRLDEIYGFVLGDEDMITFRRLAELAIRIDEVEQLVQRVQERRSRAPLLARQSLVEAAPAWQETLAAIADRTANPRYRGLKFEPQFGLLPLGQDPHSGLFEFAHLPSGSAPRRRPDGVLEMTEDCGVVLVLLPGGYTRIGADLDPAGPQYDPEARGEESPSVVVRLDPFLLAKHELTQGQWLRQMGSLTGTWKPGFRPHPDSAPVTLLHPIHPISVREASKVLRQLGLDLPTGAQWEYGARGGTSTPWWTGSDPASLQGAENLCDLNTNLLTDHSNPTTLLLAGLQAADPWPFTAPVDTLRPNPFGLHHVLGNAPELCRDAARNYRMPLHDGDGCSDNVDNGSIRLGSFSCLPGSARVARRGDVGYDTLEGGVRPMLRLEGTWTIDPDTKTAR